MQAAEGEAQHGAHMDKDLASMAVDDLETVEQVEEAMNAPAVSKTRKQKLKQRLKALQVRVGGHERTIPLLQQILM